MNTKPISPGRIWYLLPAIIAVAAFLIFPAALWRALTDKTTLAFQFKASGGKDFEITRPDTYVLWHETQTMFEGTVYSSSSNLPSGTRFVLTGPANANIPMSPDLFSTETFNSTVRESVGKFTVTTPGKYHISVDGQFSDQIFYFRESLWRQVRPVLHAVALMAAGWTVALGLAIYLFVRRRAARFAI